MAGSFRIYLSVAAAVLGFGCATKAGAAVTGTPFGTSPDGKQVQLFTLKNSKGIEALIMTWGGTVVSLKVPDAKGHFDDVVLGYDDLQGYLNNSAYFGALIGRYANRIGHAQFTLDGHTYHLFKNDGDNSLHGGKKGFDKRNWDVVNATDHSLELRYVSADGEEGYPGKLTATVTYTVTPENELKIDYAATTDKDTVVNLTNHSYFNLAGAGSGTILDEDITINAAHFTPVDAGLIPTGEIRSVAGTPLDFRNPHRIGERIDSDYEQIKLGKGYDHNFVLDRHGNGLSPAARVHDPKSGRVMEVLTTQPGLQFYTSNMLKGPMKGRDGKTYNYRGALCLEADHYPDSPNKPNFPSTELKPGQTYHETTVYRFSTR
ncbi:MAG TPA: aldose epimerase family protein [Bryobacteraceae bacterium]|nr:aldose epimerase family protein [Bryobacteraceae bacterium]